MDLKLDGKSVIITGGGSNIGRGITLAFAAEGARVAIADIDQAQATKVAAEAKSHGAKDACIVHCDVTDNDSVIAMARSVERQFGEVDVLVNNVGWTFDRLFVEKPRAEWEKEIQINLWGVINCTRAVLDGMIKRKSGVVISIGSDAGRIGEFREAVYGACKAGVMSLTKTLAREYGKVGLRFNVVCPGTTMPPADEELSESSMWASSHVKDWLAPEMRERIAKLYPLRRVGTPQDVAAAVVFLASEQASFITGQTLSASGGYSMA